MKYEKVRPPVLKPTHSMTPEEAREHYQWFISSIPQRILVLEGAVRSSGGEFANWNADMTPESLDVLAWWLQNNVSLRGKTDQEIEESAQYWNMSAQEALDSRLVQPTELSDETISLAMDSGMYLGEVLRNNNPLLTWRHFTKRRSDINYQKPVLTGLAKPIEPIGLMIGFLNGLVFEQASPAKLRDLYEYWSKPYD
jgi:hypothetical protein